VFLILAHLGVKYLICLCLRAFSSSDLNVGGVVPDLGVSRATPDSTVHVEATIRKQQQWQWGEHDPNFDTTRHQHRAVRLFCICAAQNQISGRRAGGVCDAEKR
jgi:hypothetical protein